MFWVHFRTDFDVSAEFASPLKRISRSRSAGIWYRLFKLSIGVWPFLGCCAPFRFLDLAYATQDRCTAPAVFLFPELRCEGFTGGAGADTGGVQKRCIDIPIKAKSSIIGPAAPNGVAHEDS